MKRLRVLLIQPYITSERTIMFLTEPLGLSSLATYIQKDYDVKILDLFALSCDTIHKMGSLYRRGLSDENRIIKLVKEFNPDVIGISCRFNAYAEDTYELARLLKKNLSKIPIVIGGPHASTEAESILLKNHSIDFIVRREGEVTFKEFLDKFSINGKFKGILGLTYRTNKNKIISNPDRDLIKDLNETPLDDRRNLDMNFYLKNNSRSLSFVRQEPVASIMTSRGCPYNCVFCSTKNMWKRLWRPLSAKRVVYEMEILVKKYGAREIAIYDDQFMLDNKRVNLICDMIIKKKWNISISIPSGTSVWLADEPLLKKMKKAGFYRLCFPIESGSEKTMKFIGKPVDLKKAKKTIEIANRLGFWTQGNFIVGFPYETREDIKESLKYAFDSGLDYAVFFIAKPYKGAELYDILLKEKLLTEVARGSDVATANYDTKTMKASEIQQLRDAAANGYLQHRIKFFLNPINFYKYFLPKISDFKGIKYAFKAIFRLMALKDGP